jgi:hypothetical protein
VLAVDDKPTGTQRRIAAREQRRSQQVVPETVRASRPPRHVITTLVVVGLLGAVLFQAFLGGPDTLDAAIVVSSADAVDARSAAGCVLLADREPLRESSHYPSEVIPPAGVAFGHLEIRPTHSGPHAASVYPVSTGAKRPIDEVVSTHNLEHGSIIVWFDADRVAGQTKDIASWARLLNVSGFAHGQGGVGILASPYGGNGISSGKAVALRAWGTALDCDTWNETVANAFVLEHFGSRGIAPEAGAVRFPDSLLSWGPARP